MEQAKAPRKALFILIWGVLFWGGSTALAITLFDRYLDRHFDTPYTVVVRFVTYMAAGILWGLWLWAWSGRRAMGRQEPTRTGTIVRLALFIGLMTGLACALWIMTRH